MLTGLPFSVRKLVIIASVLSPFQREKLPSSVLASRTRHRRDSIRPCCFSVCNASSEEASLRKALKACWTALDKLP